MGNQSRQKSLVEWEYSHPLVSCMFWLYPHANLELFLETLKIAPLLTGTGNVLLKVLNCFITTKVGDTLIQKIS